MDFWSATEFEVGSADDVSRVTVVIAGTGLFACGLGIVAAARGVSVVLLAAADVGVGVGVGAVLLAAADVGVGVGVGAVLLAAADVGNINDCMFILVLFSKSLQFHLLFF